jgi:S1-C subfamily serine protease
VGASGEPDGLIQTESRLGAQKWLPDGSTLDIMNEALLYLRHKRRTREDILYPVRSSGMDKEMWQRSTMIDRRLWRAIRASFAGAIAVTGFWLLLTNTGALGSEMQEPKSGLLPGIADRLSPASRARLNLKTGSAQKIAKSAQGAAVAAGRPGRLPSDDWTYRPTVLVRRGKNQGSGTIIASIERETLVLTAAHVVQGKGPIIVELHRFNLGVERNVHSADSWPRRITSTLVASDLAGDLAVLRVQGLRALPYVARLSRDEADPLPDSSVTSIGIDLGVELAGWSSQVIDILTFELNGNREQRPFVITEYIPEHGHSGGGLFLANGDLAGVCVGHAELVAGRRMGVFASRKSIRFLLEDHKLTAAILRSETRRARLSSHLSKGSQPARDVPNSTLTPTHSIEKDPPVRAVP